MQWLWSICLIRWTCHYSTLPVSVTKSALKGRFTSAEEVTANAMKALLEVLKICFQQCPKSFMNINKYVSLPKETTLKEMLCK
jgi:hypothetical protein